MNKKELLNLLNSVETESPHNPHERVLLIDSLNLFFRNFAMMNFINSQGMHIGGLGGFLRSIIALTNQIQPTSIYIVFDGIGSSANRKNINPDYKSGRNITRITNWETFEDIDEENEAKRSQITRLVQYLKCLPVKIISIDKTEADDVIAYLSKILPTKYNSQTFIVSNDQDFIQLINNNVTLYRPSKKDYYDTNLVKEDFGVLPENFILYKTLIGDNSDKIEGIKGLGKKGLIKKFPELKETPLTLPQLFTICESKYKEHIVYSKILFDKNRLEDNFRIMNLHNPLIMDVDKEYIDSYVESPTPQLNVDIFLKFYNEDELGKLIKTPEYTLRNTFKNIK
jgi:DNA polymerase I